MRFMNRHEYDIAAYICTTIEHKWKLNKQLKIKAQFNLNKLRIRWWCNYLKNQKNKNTWSLLVVPHLLYQDSF